MRFASKLFIFAIVAMAVAAAPQADAIILDLTTSGSSGTIGDGFFLQVDDQSTGTGVIDPFVRIQNNPTELGFNTDHRPLNGDLDDVNNSPQFTHSIKVNEIGSVDLGGVESIRFLLDINESGNTPLISMNSFHILTAGRGDIGNLADLFSEGTSIYDMDMSGDNTVELNYILNSGSGSGDMFAYLPRSLFAGKEDQFLYLFSAFGVNQASDAGFEEWARIDGTTENPIPEPGTMLLLGSGLLGGLAARRRRKK